MSELTTPHVSREELKQEHQELDQQIAQWREWWEERQQLGRPVFGEMADRVEQFRESLSAHFHHEEFSGPLAELAHSSDSSIQLEVLEFWEEHHRILETLDRVVERLRHCKPEETCWTTARSEFEAVINRFETQRNKEEALLDNLPKG